MPHAAAPAGALDENPPHRLGRRAEEVAAAVPLLRALSRQPQPGLMDQRGRLKGLPGRFLCHPRAGQCDAAPHTPAAGVPRAAFGSPLRNRLSMRVTSAHANSSYTKIL